MADETSAVLPHRALIECMLMMGAADGVIRGGEIERLATTVCEHPVFAGFSHEDATREISAGAERLVAEGLEARLQALTKGLPTYPLRLLAFAFSAGVSLADGEFAREELSLLKRIQSELGLRDDDVAEVITAVQARGDVDDLIERLLQQHLTEAGTLGLGEAYIEVMLLMAAADGEVQKEEATQLALTIANHAQFASMSEADISAAVSGALERIQREGDEQRLHALGARLAGEEERLQALSFAYSILVADGVMAPGESRCLERMLAAFGLEHEALRKVLASA